MTRASAALAPAPHPARRRRLVAVLGALCALLLTACGARVDTVFTLDDGPSGSRVITLTLSASDLASYVPGGVPALESTIQAHKPAELDYAGIATTEDQVTATFAVTFDSPETYRTKVAAILAAGGWADTPTTTIAIEDSLFVQGAAVEEDFTSIDLLGWLGDGLVADGTVSADHEGDLFSSGSTEVVRDGESTSTSSAISYSDMVDHGITSVQMTTRLVSARGYEREITLRMPTDSYASDPDAFDSHLAEVTPPDGSLRIDTGNGYDVGWTITFSAADPASIAATTDAVLGSDGSVLTVDEQPDPANPTRRVTTVVDTAECAAICSPRADPITSTIVVPATWELTGGPADASTGAEGDELTVDHRPSATALEFEHAVPFTSVHVTTTLGLGGSVHQTLAFTVPDEDVAAADGGFATLLTPPEGTDAELTVTDADGLTTYTLTVQAADIDSYNATLSWLAPGSWMSVEPTDGDGLFWSRYRVTLGLDLAGSLASGGVTDGITYETVLPFPQRYSAEDSVVEGAGTLDGRRATSTSMSAAAPAMSLAVSGPTVVTLVLSGLLVLGLLCAAALLVLFRAKVRVLVTELRARWARRRAERRAVQAAAAAAPAGAGPSGSGPGLGAPPSVPVGPPGSPVLAAGAFTEADLV